MKYLSLLALMVACGSNDPAPAPAPIPTTGAPVAIVYAGQSNAASIATDALPDGIPSNAVPYWPIVISRSIATQPGPLEPLPDGTHGAECEFGLVLLAHGRAPKILKVARGGSSVVMWAAGGMLSLRLTDAIQKFKATLTEPHEWHFVWDQGEREAVAATPAAASLWGDGFRSVVSEVQAACGCDPVVHIVRTNSALADGLQVATVRQQQEAAGALIIDSDGLPTIEGTHRTGTSQNTVGDRIAASIETP